MGTIADILENLALKQMESATRPPVCESCGERLAHGEELCARCPREEPGLADWLNDRALEKSREENYDF